MGEDGVSYWRLAPATLLAAPVAGVVDAIVYHAASWLGCIPRGVLVPGPGGEQPLTVASVVVGSVAVAIGASVVFAVIGMYSRRPVRLFRIVSVVALALSFAGPLTITGAPLSMILSLEVMHVMAWAVIVGLLTMMAGRKGSGDAWNEG